MTSLFKDYYYKVGRSPLYWIPLLIFSIVGYSFSIYNRTIHWDDLLKDSYNEIMLSNRWGMVLWGKLVGVMDLVPFIDRFVTLFFWVIASVLMGTLFFFLNRRQGEVLSYTVLSSMILTFPLTNEIYEFTGADLQYTGNLSLMIFAFIYLTVKREKPTLKTVAVACLIMVLPASSYEVGLFSYLTLLCAVILYKYCIIDHQHVSMRQWLAENVYYLIPLVLAVALRFIIAFVLREIYDLPFSAGGSTTIDYEETTFTYLLGSNGFRYFAAGLVYFPITIFVILSLVFMAYMLYSSVRRRNYQIILLGVLLYVSLFSLTIIQGVCLQYRTAQSLTLFVALVSFLLCDISLRNSKYQFVIPSVFLFLCWHQAVYLNNVLSLNNMRSNNEISRLQYIGNRIMGEFGKYKPVVVIVDEEGQLGPWIDKRVYANPDTWNGRLLNHLCESYLPEQYHHYKFINTNIVDATKLGGTLKSYFAYCGYDINVSFFSSILKSVNNPDQRVLLEQQYEKAVKEMHYMEIRDIGQCLLVKL